MRHDSRPPASKRHPKSSWLARVRGGLARTTHALNVGIGGIIGSQVPDSETLDEMKDLLLSVDIGALAASEIVSELAKQRFSRGWTLNDTRLALSELISGRLDVVDHQFDIDSTLHPHIILFSGVNGSGKTTTIGKLAARWQYEGKKVLVAACDTYRAAAVEQLSVWTDRAGVELISAPSGADPAATAYQAVDNAKTCGADAVLIDTAGRLQNRTGLMDELQKIIRVIRKLDSGAPHSSFLVLDATVGQNGLSQVETFRDVAGVTGLIMTKLDGTARGGILVALTDQFRLPIPYIGVGESIDDLQEFAPMPFSRSLIGLDS